MHLFAKVGLMKYRSNCSGGYIGRQTDINISWIIGGMWGSKVYDIVTDLVRNNKMLLPRTETKYYMGDIGEISRGKVSRVQS